MHPALVPSLGVKDSDGRVKVSVINTTAQISRVDSGILFQRVVGALHTSTFPSFSFLVENETRGQKVLFDLGIAKDWESKNAASSRSLLVTDRLLTSHAVVDFIRQQGWAVSVEKGVAEILAEHGVDIKSIDSIIWSHCHWDHLGDPSTFPTSTSLVLGPDGQRRCQSSCDASCIAGRELRELSMADFITHVAGFPALDYFGDGSFYLLSAPGHTADHLCALARTTVDPPTFIFMAADAVHHAGEHRPSKYVPLPTDEVPNPANPNVPLASQIFRALHPRASDIEPFLYPAYSEDEEANRSTVEKLQILDAHEDVLVISAHDASLLDVLNFFPASANHWKSAGWREKAYWTFLTDFQANK